MTGDRGQAEEVRNILARAGGTTFKGLCERLDIVATKGKKLLRLTLRDLQRTREVGHNGNIYYLHFRQPKPGRGDLQDKLWEACKTEKPGFTAGQVVTLAGGSAEYAGRCLRFWWREGFLEPTGRKPSRRFGRAMAFRIVPGKEKETPPRWCRRAEEKKSRGQGSGVGDQVAACVREVQAAMQFFIRGLREKVAVHNDEVKEMLREMEEDLERAPRGEPPRFHAGGVVTIDNKFPPGFDADKVARIIQRECCPLLRGKPRYLGPDGREKGKDGLVTETHLVLVEIPQEPPVVFDFAKKESPNGPESGD